MTQRLRFAFAACVGLSALAFAGQALGAYQPKLLAASSPTSITVGYRQGSDDDASAALIFYAPPGMQADLSAAAGTTIGAAVAKVNVAGAEPTISGTVLVGNQTDPTTATFTTRCTGTPTHDAVWILHVTLNDQAIDVPASVDRTTGQEAAFSSYKIRVCFRSPYIPEGQGGQPLGVKPLEASLTLNGVFTPPSAAGLRWTGLFVPYTVGTGTANLAGAAESQAIAGYPVRLTLAGKSVVKKKTVGKGRRKHVVKAYWARVTGRLREGGDSQGGAGYTLFAGAKKVATGETNANGSFTKLIRITRATTFRATASLDPIDASGACNPLIPINLSPLINPTCTGLTDAGLQAGSNRVTVKTKK
jgi:hypothetical protein